jgi:hypothetical protein
LILFNFCKNRLVSFFLNLNRTIPTSSRKEFLLYTTN